MSAAPDQTVFPGAVCSGFILFALTGLSLRIFMANKINLFYVFLFNYLYFLVSALFLIRQDSVEDDISDTDKQYFIQKSSASTRLQQYGDKVSQKFPVSDIRI